MSQKVAAVIHKNLYNDRVPQSIQYYRFKIEEESILFDLHKIYTF